jgi:hydroxymethylbilane synthase
MAVMAKVEGKSKAAAGGPQAKGQASAKGGAHAKSASGPKGMPRASEAPAPIAKGQAEAKRPGAGASHGTGPSSRALVIGTRGSALALTQSNLMAEALRKAHKGLEVRLEIIKTEGDADQKTKLHAFAGMGVFVKELQTALLEKRIDCAVHSLKDVPEEEPEGLMLAAFPEREDPRDVFISDGRAFHDLPPGSKVGTGSPRRVLQLKALRPDLEYVGLRGNVDTRIGKARSGEVAGVVLAAAGLLRLGRAEDITHAFSFQEMVPAIGQASLGLECRVDDARVRKILEAVDDPETHDSVTLERDFMKRIGGGCKVPMAAHVYPYGEGLRILAVLGNPATGVLARVEQTLDEDEEDEMLEEVALRMEDACREKGIPLPHEVADHALLSGGAFGASAFLDPGEGETSGRGA